MSEKKITNQLPDWLKIKVKNLSKVTTVAELLNANGIHTVCQEANCPNLIECFSKKTATFMILGNLCTRNCTFCDVKSGTPQKVDPKEPEYVAKAVKDLNLKYTVITSVTRDDLRDGGASHFVRVIEEIEKVTDSAIEVLIPDFMGNKKALAKVIRAKPKVINHNVETIERLYPSVRPTANYHRSLLLIKRIKEMDNAIYTKSGFMVGLGETQLEVKTLLNDLRKTGCDFVTIGQYLAPSKNHHPVVEYVHPAIFTEYEQYAKDIGFNHVASAPLVRSSYHAAEALRYTQR